jgi:hypothetical protein
MPPGRPKKAGKTQPPVPPLTERCTRSHGKKTAADKTAADKTLTVEPRRRRSGTKLAVTVDAHPTADGDLKSPTFAKRSSNRKRAAVDAADPRADSDLNAPASTGMPLRTPS